MLKMYKYLLILLGYCFAGTLFAAEKATWNFIFSNKTQSSIEMSGKSDSAANAQACSVVLFFEGGRAGNYQTAGGAGTDKVLFTPKTNVQLGTANSNNPQVGAWQGNFLFTLPETCNLSAITFNLITFNSSGDFQGENTTRSVRLTAKLAEKTASSVFSVSGSTNGSMHTLNFNESIRLEKDIPYILTVTAERAEETLGAYFGIRNWSFKTITPGENPTVEFRCQDTTSPQGYVAKLSPRKATSYFVVNTQKPALICGRGTFEIGTEKSITLIAPEDIDWNQLLRPGNAYVLEVKLDNGTVFIPLNREFWLKQKDDWTANGNRLNFIAPMFADLWTSQASDTAMFKLRAAWTLEELFGELYRNGDLKRGSALTGDVIFIYGQDDKTAVKFYNHKTKGWVAVGVKDKKAVPASAAVFPFKPLRIVRKQGKDAEFNLIGEASSGARLLPIHYSVDVVATGASFPQTLEISELSGIEGLQYLLVENEKITYDSKRSIWKNSKNKNVSALEIEDKGIEIKRNQNAKASYIHINAE